MPTPDDSMLNPISDVIETHEQKEQRLKREAEILELLREHVPLKANSLATRRSEG